MRLLLKDLQQLKFINYVKVTSTKDLENLNKIHKFVEYQI